MLHIQAEVSLRDFVESDRPLIDAWAQRIGSTNYMARYTPAPGSCLLWCIVQADGLDVGTVWLENLAEPGAANLGILLGDPSVFGRGIGQKAINLAIEKACATSQLRAIRLHVRDGNERAIACYERCGFRVVDSTTRVAGGKSYMVLGMERLLDHRSAT